jgi:hypothetical protein
MLALRFAPCWHVRLLHAGIEISFMLAWRKTPTLHGVEAAGGVTGFSLLTGGDVVCNSGWVAEE